MSKQAINQAHSLAPDLPRREVMFLVEYLTGKPVDQLVLHEMTLSDSQRKKLVDLAAMRRDGIPIQLITGTCAFMDFEVKVEKGVLIPRPETEQLVDNTVKKLTRKPERIVEVGTGTGVIAIALAGKFPNASILATDICPQALDLAHRNAARLDVGGKIEFVQADIFPGDCRWLWEEKADLIISNPPYIPSAAIEGLDTEVRDFDPRKALDGGADGCEVIRRILDQSEFYLADTGLIALEIDPAVKEPLKRYQKNSRFDLSFEKDTYGNLRFLFGRKR